MILSTFHIISHLVRHKPTKWFSDNQNRYNIYIYIYIYIRVQMSLEVWDYLSYSTIERSMSQKFINSLSFGWFFANSHKVAQRNLHINTRREKSNPLLPRDRIRTDVFTWPINQATFDVGLLLSCEPCFEPDLAGPNKTKYISTSTTSLPIDQDSKEQYIS